ncbi:uncharacterized protein M437DRAFT_40814 [Aureobasidium melanogenum CBS 110374]|uniref:Rab proteins geranylgeranyltransferase n=1 Tax=Aureobasidium melanogenum (strain CBS 110374) TaxID=1043003 RepID=A0A074W256_AURM1|nr:uncharacterized protein M437DRAFT_40814 [Aureobasidium melanogenum CBS 110374]KEQ65604.1 hypothetical protein M437DRAFT_40814 [Aureobasidium melanogenum CBS 110374]
MDSLDGSSYDVLISGTGIQQSLLALALSRSGKKVLHVDKDDTYGGPEAALSLQEAEQWVEKLDSAKQTRFSNASITKSAEGEQKLSPSRAYNLSLAPTLVYTRSGLLPILVSSKTNEQLEFMAVGGWFVFEKQEDGARVVRVPNGREDIFADPSLTLKMKGQLMKFLRFVAAFEEKPETWQPHREVPFANFLSEQFGLPAVDTLMALCLSLETPEKTTTEFALPRIARHLRSIGVFGPGFGAVIPKWGGLSEVVQVACRACAVGGGIYVLGQGISSIEPTQSEDDDSLYSVQLSNGEKVSAQFIVGCSEDLPGSLPATTIGTTVAGAQPDTVSRSITIISSPMQHLFVTVAEGGVSPAGAVVVFPAGSLSSAAHPPVQILVHSSDTGECPQGQCVAYSSTALAGQQGQELLAEAIKSLLAAQDCEAQALWSLSYEQHAEAVASSNETSQSNILKFQDPPLDFVFDDAIIENVQAAWQTILPEADDFMVFGERNEDAQEEAEDEE